MLLVRRPVWTRHKLKAENLIKEAIENAARMSHIGFLQVTLVDSSMFPRIVGTKDANVARFRLR